MRNNFDLSSWKKQISHNSQSFFLFLTLSANCRLLQNQCNLVVAVLTLTVELGDIVSILERIRLQTVHAERQLSRNTHKLRALRDQNQRTEHSRVQSKNQEGTNATNRGADGMEGILTGGDRGRGGGGGERGRGAAGCPLLFGLSRAAPAPFLAAAVLPAAWAGELLAAAARSSTSVPAARSSDGSSSCAIVAVEAVPAEFLAVPSSWSAAAVQSSPAPSCSTAAAALALPSAASSCTSGAPVADDGAASGSAVPLMSSFSSVSPSPRLAT